MGRRCGTEQLEREVYALAERLCSIPVSQLTAMKVIVSQAYENVGPEVHPVPPR